MPRIKWPEKHGLLPSSNMIDVMVCIACDWFGEKTCPHNEAIDACIAAEKEARVVVEELGLILYQELRGCGAELAKEEWTAKHLKTECKIKASWLSKAIHSAIYGDTQGEEK